MSGSRFYSKFDDGDDYCVWIKDAERGTIELI